MLFRPKGTELIYKKLFLFSNILKRFSVQDIKQNTLIKICFVSIILRTEYIWDPKTLSSLTSVLP